MVTGVPTTKATYNVLINSEIRLLSKGLFLDKAKGLENSTSQLWLLYCVPFWDIIGYGKHVFKNQMPIVILLSLSLPDVRINFIKSRIC